MKLAFNLPCHDGTLSENCGVFGLDIIWFGR